MTEEPENFGYTYTVEYRLENGRDAYIPVLWDNGKRRELQSRYTLGKATAFAIVANNDRIRTKRKMIRKTLMKLGVPRGAIK